MTKHEFCGLIKRSKPIGAMLALLFTVVVLIVCLAGIIADASYSKKMSSLDRTSQPVAGADRIAMYFEENDTYTDRYVPEELLADNPEETAVVIIYENGTILDGFYPNGAKGFIRTTTLSWYDLKAQRVLVEKTFEGSGAPYSIKSNDKSDQYGSHPDSSKITNWINEMAQLYLQ